MVGLMVIYILDKPLASHGVTRLFSSSALEKGKKTSSIAFQLERVLLNHIPSQGFCSRCAWDLFSKTKWRNGALEVI